jgi:hypothetical protein
LLSESSTFEARLAAMPVISGWNPFDALLDAIEQTRDAAWKVGVRSDAR